MGDSRRSVALALCLTMFMMQAPRQVGADDVSLKEMVLREYPQALNALENRFLSVKGVVRSSIAIRRIDGDRLSNETATFECKLPYMSRVVRDREDTQKKKREQLVICYNRDYSFELSKHHTNSGWFISFFENNLNGKSKLAKGAMFTSLLQYLNAPFLMYVPRLSSLFAEEGFSVRAVTRVRDGDKQMLKVEFDRKPDSKGRKGSHGWFVVSPDEAWVLHSFEYQDKNGNSYSGTMEYAGVERGVPVPKRVVHTIRGGRDPRPSVFTYDFDELSFVDVPDRDFTLDAFGLPELAQSGGRSTRGSPARWFFALSLAAMAIALILKVASSRFKTKSPIGV
jgi:hypothetical protein